MKAWDIFLEFLEEKGDYVSFKGHIKWRGGRALCLTPVYLSWTLYRLAQVNKKVYVLDMIINKGYYEEHSGGMYCKT